ncbi:MAG: AMP-binding protein [Ruminococcus flavefaciens]|nr:AMP-binding protein [Ruminococcus flavefaciens]
MDKNNIKTLQELVDAAANEHGDRVFIREKDGKEVVEKTFVQFREDVKKVMAFVNTFRDGEPIHCAVAGASSYAWLLGYFGTVCGGNACVPLDAQLGEDDIAELLNRSDSVLFFYDKRFVKMLDGLKEKCPEIKYFISLENDMDGILEKYQPEDFKPVEPSALAAISYTSGTTGKSKGVMLLNSNLIDNTMCQDNESVPDDVVMSVLPIHHIYCFTCDILLSLRYGYPLCFNDSMMRIPQNLKLFKPTTILLVPMIAETLYKMVKNISASEPDTPLTEIAERVFGGRLKTIFSGGAYLRPELQRAYLDMGIAMAQGYGMTECSPRISTADKNDTECAGDVGIIVNGCQVKTVDGEIMVKSPSVMAGYYKDEQATAEALTPDGWLHTGDLGYVDDKNRLFLTGRKKNLIILSNGENVSPEELENKFAGLEYISEIIVYSDDSVICAEIFPNRDLYTDEQEIERMFRETVDNINKTVPPAKAIRRLRIRDNGFDRTASNKIKRQQSEHGRIIK